MYCLTRNGNTVLYIVIYMKALHIVAFILVIVGELSIGSVAIGYLLEGNLECA
jgi:hypothetical protein